MEDTNNTLSLNHEKKKKVGYMKYLDIWVKFIDYQNQVVVHLEKNQ